MTIPRQWGRSFAISWSATAFAILWVLGGHARAGAGPDASDSIAKGREIFIKEWIPGVGTQHGGDGLGPVYNDTSCMACHGMGGPGGAGSASKNAEILTAIPIRTPSVQVELKAVMHTQEREASQSKVNPDEGDLDTVLKKKENRLREIVVSQKVTVTNVISSNSTETSQPRKANVEELARLHPAFRTTRSVTLHMSSTDPAYPAWKSRLMAVNDAAVQVQSAGTRVTAEDRMKLDMMSIRNRMANRSTKNIPQAQHGGFNVVLSRRNAPALFGDGLIDAIPECAIREAARATFPEFPEIKGRVSRLPDRSIGRFGWKAQTASLKEFVLTACAVELGLEVPDHPQGRLPYTSESPHARKPGLDLDSSECDALIAFVRNLQPPSRRKPSSRREAETMRDGKKRFEEAGCATCHRPNLGSIADLYSDLLLHDMGPELADNGIYGNVPSGTDPDDVPDEVTGIAGIIGGALPIVARPARGAGRQEWRTPPLWGFRDSGPYMHDGRATNLEEAVALHGGQAARSAQKFFQLKPDERLQIESFLKSLTAPAATNLAQSDRR